MIIINTLRDLAQGRAKILKDVLEGTQYGLSITLDNDKWYTLFVQGDFAENEFVGVWLGENNYIGYLLDNKISFKLKENYIDTNIILKSLSGEGIINTIILVEGSVKWSWSPAPEDFANFKGKEYHLSTPFIKNEWYTLTVQGSFSPDAFVGVWASDYFVGYLQDDKMTFKLTEDIEVNSLVIKSSDEQGEIEWVKLERGEYATPWSPAPEDLYNKNPLTISSNLELNQWYTVQVKTDINDFIAAWAGDEFIGFLKDDRITFRILNEIEDKTLILSTLGEGNIEWAQVKKVADTSPTGEKIDFSHSSNYSLSVYDYKKNKLVDLKNKNISIIGQAYNTELKSNVNGSKELNFVLPLIVNEDGEQKPNFRWDFIQAELLIKLSYRTEEDWFIIKSFDDVRSDSGILTSNIQCKHISNLLVQSGLDLYIDHTGNLKELFTMVLKDSGWSVGDVVNVYNSDGVEQIRTLKLERSNRYNAIQELAELFNVYPVFNPDKTIDFRKEIGNNNGVIFRYGKNLKNVRRTVGNSGEVITKLWVEGGNDNIGIVTISNVNPTGENYILNFDYFIEGGFLTPEQIQAIDNFELSVKPLNENIKQQLNNITNALNAKSNKENELDSKVIFKSSKEQTRDEIILKIQTETNAGVKQELIDQREQLNSEISTLSTEIAQLENEITTLDNSISTYEGKLVTDRENKKAASDNLHSLLSDFIREGLWQDSNYVDAQALYDDALEQSKLYAHPLVSYETGILDLSHLTGYEIERFGLGDIIRIIDEKLRVDTLGRITEMSINLDKPQNVSVQIGNYYSNFEDLFKRISESAEIIKQRQEIYERAVGINPDGTVNFDVLQKTFDNNKFRVVSGTNNSVKNDEKGITITSLDDINKKVRINAGGVFITVDGGENWKVGMSPEGFSALNITSGVVDTKLLQIWNSNEPRFRWVEDGLFALGNNENTWIKFNEEGFKFTRNNGLSYDVEITWDGFALRDENNEVLITPAGILDTNNINRSDNVASGYPLIIKFYIDDQVNLVDKVFLRLTNENFRAYSSGAASGGGATSGASSSSTTASGGMTTSGASSSSTTASGGATTSGASSSSTTSDGGSSSPTSGASSSSTTSDGGSSTRTSQSPTQVAVLISESGVTAGTAVGTNHAHSFNYYLFPESAFNNHVHKVSISDHSHGMAHTHKVSISDHSHGMAHTHSIGTHSHGMAHTHSIGTHSHGMAHTHSTPNHTHDITYGLYENNNTNNTVTIFVDGVQRASSSTKDASINLSSWITIKGWHTVELRSTVLKRISAGLFIKSYIQR